MWNLLMKKQTECSLVRDFLEQGGDLAALAPPLQTHLQSCPECQAAVDAFLMGRALLRAIPSRASAAGPWFVPRVMAAIAARETELRRSLETWAFVPRLAARLTWVSALALLLAGTWLYEMPQSAKSSGDGGVESLFDPSPAPAAQDDVLANQVESNPVQSNQVKGQ